MNSREVLKKYEDTKEAVYEKLSKGTMEKKEAEMSLLQMASCTLMLLVGFLFVGNEKKKEAIRAKERQNRLITKDNVSLRGQVDLLMKLTDKGDSK